MRAIGQISILHLILLVMTCIGLKNHVTILPPLLSEVKRDGWMSVLISMLLFLPWIFIIVYIQKRTNSQPINVWLKERIGKIPSVIVLYSTIIFIYFLAAFSMRETILWISATFLNDTPQILLLSIYIITCFLLASTNIQTIVITNAFVLFFIVIFGYYVALVNMKLKDYSLLLPSFEHGFTPILLGVAYPASGFIELIFIIYLQHYLKAQLKWKNLLIIILILTGLTLGPLTGAIAEFGPTEAAKQKYPAYEEWGLVTLGEFIDHLDFLSIHQWLAGTFIRVGTLLFIVVDILNIYGKPKKIWLYLLPPFFILNLFFTIMDDTFFLYLNNFTFLIISLIYLFLLSIVLLLASMKGKKKNTMNQESVTNNGPKEGSINITINQSFNGQSNGGDQSNVQSDKSNQSGAQSHQSNGSQSSGQSSQSSDSNQSGQSTNQSNEPINITINQSIPNQSGYGQSSFTSQSGESEQSHAQSNSAGQSHEQSGQQQQQPDASNKSNEQSGSSSSNGQPNSQSTEPINISINQQPNAVNGSTEQSRSEHPNNLSSNQSNGQSKVIQPNGNESINISINLPRGQSNEQSGNATDDSNKSNNQSANGNQNK